MPSDAPVNLLLALRAQSVDIYDLETGALFAAGADIHEAFGDEIEECRDAVLDLARTGHHIAGGGAAPAYLVVPAGAPHAADCARDLARAAA